MKANPLIMSWHRFGPLFTLCFALSCVSFSLMAQPEYKPVSLPEPKIQYLGVGGWLLHWRGEGLLIAPSFSNPALMNHKGWPPVRVAANKEKIDTFMPPADDVTLLLVGHGHYDHLLDVPWIMATKTPRAILYGSKTVKNILFAFSDRQKMAAHSEPWVDPVRVVDATPKMERIPGCEEETEQKKGEWIPSSGGHIRVMPIQSMHASHVLGFTVAHGESPVLDDIPKTVFGWKQGQSMAWLIELLETKPEGKKVVYRIHFQDSPATPPCGFPPATPEGEQTAVDVEILGVGGWENVRNYPDALLKRTHPRLVLLGHWENFFGNDLHRKPTSLRGQNTDNMRQIVDKVLKAEHNSARVQMPNPLDDIALPPPP